MALVFIVESGTRLNPDTFIKKCFLYIMVEGVNVGSGELIDFLFVLSDLVRCEKIRTYLKLFRYLPHQHFEKS